MTKLEIVIPPLKLLSCTFQTKIEAPRAKRIDDPCTVQVLKATSPLIIISDN